VAVTLSIVVPLRDERPNIAPLFEELDHFRAGFPYEMELILVDDGSRDGSWAAIAEGAAGRGWARALRLRANRGQTAAMVAGIQASQGEYVTFLDADLQNDPADIHRLLAPVMAGDADVACGWRRERKDNAARTVPSVVANWLIRKVLRLKIHDLGCTLKVFRREYLEQINMIGEMHRFLAAYAQAQGAKLMEMEVTHRPRVHGTSKYGLSRIGKVLIDLLTVVMLNTYGASPAYLFGKIAAALFLIGTVMFSIVSYRAFVLGRVESTPMIFMMLLMYIAALIALMSGLLAEMNMRVLYQVGVYKPFDVRERIGFENRRSGASRECAASSAE
jgi:glycosyltransferase involved in cell wall biosynthesis